MAQASFGLLVCERLRARAAVEVARYEDVVLASFAARCDGGAPELPVAGPGCGCVRVLGGRCLAEWKSSDPGCVAVRVGWCEGVAEGTREPELLALVVERMVLEWRLEFQRVKLSSILANAYRRLTDFAMVQELVAGLAETPSEEKVVERVFDFFSSLLASEWVAFVSVERGVVSEEWLRGRVGDQGSADCRLQGADGKAGEASGERRATSGKRREGGEGLAAGRRAELAGFSRSYEWGEGYRCLRVSVRHRGRLLGVLEVAGVAAPEFREHYLDLSLAVARVMGLAISSARLYRELKGPEQSSLEFAEDLRDALEGRKRAEERQAQLMRQVAAANRELEDFAYVVSHDLKAPLRAIDSLARWVLADYGPRLDEEGRAQLGLLVQRADRMRGLIDGILEYSRAGRLRSEPVPVELGAVVAEVVEGLAVPECIRVSVEGPFPCVLGDRTRFEQLFQNLLSNAIRYMDKPEGRVAVGCRDAGEEWLLSVADNGPGIAEKDFGRVWQVFETLRPRDAAGESTGIGLSVVKRVVELFGGRVWLESVVGEGSTFFFTLPKAEGRRETSDGRRESSGE